MCSDDSTGSSSIESCESVLSDVVTEVGSNDLDNMLNRFAFWIGVVVVL